MFRNPKRMKIERHPLRGALSEHKQIEEEVMTYYETQRQTNELYNKKMRLRDALQAILKDVFPYCDLYVVGSSANGFGTNRSDMDVCLMLSQSELVREQSAVILKTLERALRMCKFLKELQFVNAKVPILKFTDSYSGVECDLNINNDVGIRNTYLLNAYSKLDRRLGPLVHFVKHWASFHNINNAQFGTLSSYSLVLLIIHYLQAGAQPPVLPSLQNLDPEQFSATRDVRELSLTDSPPEFASDNDQNVGDLFVGFLHYYSTVFKFDDQAASVRLGCAVPRNYVIRQNPVSNPVNQWKCICIEEPFNLSNTARAVYDRFKYMKIRHVIDVSWKRVKDAKSTDCLFASAF